MQGARMQSLESVSASLQNSLSPGTHKIGLARWFVVGQVPPKLGDSEAVMSTKLGVQFNVPVILKE